MFNSTNNKKRAYKKNKMVIETNIEILNSEEESDIEEQMMN